MIFLCLARDCPLAALYHAGDFNGAGRCGACCPCTPSKKEMTSFIARHFYNNIVGGSHVLKTLE